MSKQVVLITGALAGIGRATAIAFAHEDAQIVVSGRREEEGRKLAAELHSLGAEAEFIRADVRHEDDVRNLVDMTVAKFGRIDTAVNNAGTEGVHGPVIDQTAESYAAIFDTNVLGVLLSMKHQMRVMQAQGSGNIINISSAFGKIGGANASVYVASKHAVEGLTKSAALEAARALWRARERGCSWSSPDTNARPFRPWRGRQEPHGFIGSHEAYRQTRGDCRHRGVWAQGSPQTAATALALDTLFCGVAIVAFGAALKNTPRAV
jgi:NADP-dependent 3-hydroxy acid dehydrogenase YdfG